MMVKNFFIKLIKNKLVVVLLLIIMFLVIIKFNFGQKKNISSTKSSTTTGLIDGNNEIKITPTEAAQLMEENNTIETEQDNKNTPVYVGLGVDSLLPYEEDTFSAKKYEDNKIYVRSKIDNKDRAERNLKYWYFLETEETLPSENIVWE